MRRDVAIDRLKFKIIGKEDVLNYRSKFYSQSDMDHLDNFAHIKVSNDDLMDCAKRAFVNDYSEPPADPILVIPESYQLDQESNFVFDVLASDNKIYSVTFQFSPYVQNVTANTMDFRMIISPISVYEDDEKTFDPGDLIRMRIKELNK